MVTSLWKVDDKATSALMERFYRHLLKEPERLVVAESLRKAQRETLAEKSYAHPYYWAAGSVTGKPGDR